VIVDTSALLAYFDEREPDHDAAAEVIESSTEPLVISPYVVAELDYLVATRHGVEPETAVLRQLCGGAWDLASFGVDDIADALTVIERYHDQRIGIADASNVVLASRRGTRTIVTLDRRHFSVLRPLKGGRFTIRP
jgi:predicted nucleic acid-binding protein